MNRNLMHLHLGLDDRGSRAQVQCIFCYLEGENSYHKRFRSNITDHFRWQSNSKWEQINLEVLFMGFEPHTFCYSGRCSTNYKSIRVIKHCFVGSHSFVEGTVCMPWYHCLRLIWTYQLIGLFIGSIVYMDNRIY